jgi:hypothetical protein
MGISRARAWLAVTALVLGSVRGDSVVAFSPTADFVSFPGNGAAFVPYIHMLDRRFKWTSQGVPVEEVTLWAEDRSEPIGRGRFLDGPDNGSASKASSSWVDNQETEVTTPNRAGSGRRNPQSGKEDEEAGELFLSREFHLFFLLVWPFLSTYTLHSCMGCQRGPSALCRQR